LDVPQRKDSFNQEEQPQEPLQQQSQQPGSTNSTAYTTTTTSCTRTSVTRSMSDALDSIEEQMEQLDNDNGDDDVHGPSSSSILTRRWSVPLPSSSSSPSSLTIPSWLFQQLGDCNDDCNNDSNSSFPKNPFMLESKKMLSNLMTTNGSDDDTINLTKGTLSAPAYHSSSNNNSNNNPIHNLILSPPRRASSYSSSNSSRNRRKPGYGSSLESSLSTNGSSLNSSISTLTRVNNHNNIHVE
jgi:hypothetical protein